jgi:hypothetical protein
MPCPRIYPKSIRTVLFLGLSRSQFASSPAGDFFSQKLEFQMTKNSPNQNNQDIAKIMAKLLNLPETRITDSIELFESIDPDLQKCLERLSLLNPKEYVSFLMMVEYFFSFMSH